MVDKEFHGMFLTNLDIAEQLFSVPVEEREALLLKLTKEHKAEFIGNTEKSVPELAIHLIKAGIKAKSYVSGKKKKVLTKGPESGKL